MDENTITGRFIGGLVRRLSKRLYTFGRFYWTFVDLQPIKLRHIGKKECLGLIDLMEERWDELMIFDPAAYGLEGQIATDLDPQQERGIKGIVPKAPPKKYQQVNSVRSLHLGFADEYELRATEGYLKANSADGMPLTLFPVSGRLYRTFVQSNRHLYIK